MKMDKDLSLIIYIVLAIFLLAIIVGVTYIGADKLKSTACQIAGTTTDPYVYQPSISTSQCTNVTGNSTDPSTGLVTVDSLTGINTVVAVVAFILGLLTLVVLMKIFKIVIDSARGFSGGNM